MWTFCPDIIPIISIGIIIFNSYLVNRNYSGQTKSPPDIRLPDKTTSYIRAPDIKPPDISLTRIPKPKNRTNKG